MKLIRIFHLLEPTEDFYRIILPFLASQDVKFEILISDVEYRAGKSSLEDFLKDENIIVRRIPSPLNVSPSPRRSDSTSFLKDRSAIGLFLRRLV